MALSLHTLKPTSSCSPSLSISIRGLQHSPKHGLQSRVPLTKQELDDWQRWLSADPCRSISITVEQGIPCDGVVVIALTGKISGELASFVKDLLHQMGISSAP